jgi:hypothetical protein
MGRRGGAPSGRSVAHESAAPTIRIGHSGRVTDQTGAGAMEHVEAAGNAIGDDEEAAIRVEIEKALESDTSVLGEVYRGLRNGLSDEELRVQRGAENPTFVWNYKRTIRALVEGDLPSAPSVAAQTAARLRKLLKPSNSPTPLASGWSSGWRSSSLGSVIQKPRRLKSTKRLPQQRPQRNTRSRASTCTRCRTTSVIRMTRSGSTRFSRLATAVARSSSDSDRRNGRPFFRRSQSFCASTRLEAGPAPTSSGGSMTSWMRRTTCEGTEGPSDGSGSSPQRSFGSEAIE